MDKKSQRRQLIGQRRQLSPSHHQQKSAQICEHLRQSDRWQQATTILAYFSFQGEPDLRGLWGTAEKTLGFPVVVDRELVFYPWQPGGKTKIGAYGITEPDRAKPPLDWDQVDLILVPAVGGDRQGYRLGYGGGFYDRLLTQDPLKQVPAIGIVFDFAYGLSFPRDPWDQPMAAFCTETGFKIAAPGGNG